MQIDHVLPFGRPRRLHKSVNNAYASELPTLVVLGNEYYYEAKSKIDELFYELIGIERSNLPNGTSYLVENLKVDDIFNNEDFLWAFQLEKNKNEEYILRLKQLRTVLLGLKSAIESELGE
ncbi:MAG: hypothetical protein GYB31_13020 [Bacteroidetes bacterium]|nr:hypothetical protein [Bacteroidota bacterium]